MSTNQETRTCRKCKYTIVRVAGEWVVADSGTTADGLSYCPPNPDAAKVGVHSPAALQKKNKK